MRQRQSKTLWRIISALLFVVGTAEAQSGATSDGALFLLLPVGARAAGMGQAVSAIPLEGESVWWNPAGLAQVMRMEGLLHHSQSLIGTGDALSAVFPSKVLGVFALSASMLNFGEQELGDTPGGATGILVPRSFVFAATYATIFGKAVRAGLTYKLVQMRADCSGACQDVESFGSSTSALDFGVQFSPGLHPFSYGIAVRNIGPRLQVVDTEQADALPSRIHIGIDYRVTAIEKSVKDTRLHVSGEIVDRLRIERPSFRMGSELRYQEKFFLRGGYVFEEGGGPSIGVGISTGGFNIDIARVLRGLSADLGEPPTFISLRYRF